jgi:hypothetical protein
VNAFRLPCRFDSPQGSDVAIFDLDPDVGITVRTLIDGRRQTRIVSPTTARIYSAVLLDNGWQLHELSPSLRTPAISPGPLGGLVKAASASRPGTAADPPSKSSAPLG